MKTPASSDSYIFSMISANFGPLRFIIKNDEDNWVTSIDQLNTRSYDYVKLCRISAFIDADIAPMAMAVCYDGTLLLPALPKFQDHSLALGKFNSILAEMLLGGIYCEAVAPDDIGYCLSNDTGYTRMIGGGRGRHRAFIMSARHKLLGADYIELMEPEIIKVKDLHDAILSGRNLISKLGNIPKEQILYAVTFYSHNQWAEALLHFWTCLERTAELVWQKCIISSEVQCTSKRRNFLQDNRTWPISTKLEIFYQKGILPDDVYTALDGTRRARNDFVHNGNIPTYTTAKNALKSFFDFLSLLASGFANTSVFDNVVDMIDARNQPQKTKAEADWSNVKYWRPIPPLPGENNWKNEDYRYAIDTKPLIEAGG